MKRREFIGVSLSSLLVGATSVGSGIEFNEESHMREFTLIVFPYIVTDDKQSRKINLVVKTEDIIPGNTLTVRIENDGELDLYGEYSSYQGAWIFNVPLEQSSMSVKLSLWVNRRHRVGDDPIEIPTKEAGWSSVIPIPQKIKLHEGELFFKHGYEGLITEEGQFTQKLFSSPNRSYSFRADSEIDVIVVGSGMGGGLLAKELCEKDLKVLLLEAGSLLFQSNVWNMPSKPMDEIRFGVKDYVLDYGLSTSIGGDIQRQLSDLENSGINIAYSGPSYICLGGKSMIWSGTILELRQWELEQWPIEIKDDLPRYYNKARGILNATVSLGPFQEKLLAEMKGKIGADYNSIETLVRAREQVNNDNVTHVSSGLYSTTSLLLEFMFNSKYSKNLKINLNHLVEKLSFQGKEINAVECYDLASNRPRSYKAKMVVLAAGGIGSAAIALRSQLHDDSGKLGKGLTDHPHYKYQVINKARFPHIDLSKLPIPITPDSHAKILLSAKESSVDKYPCNQQMLINYEYWDLMVLDKRSWEERHKDSQGGGSGDKDKGPLIEFLFYCGSKIDNKNYVNISGGFKPRVYHRRVCKVQDIHDLNIKHIASALQSIGIDVDQAYLKRKEEQSPQTWGLTEFAGGGVNHAGGSLRVGVYSHDSVVDTNLKFHQYDNLFVCDLSLFPYTGASNPSLTLSALAIRLADYLENYLRKKVID